MKYKAGQKVIIRSLEWYNKYKNGYEDIRLKDTCFRKTMALKFCGKVMTISAFDDYKDGYRMLEDKGEFFWTDEMIEGLAEEEVNFDVVVKETTKDISDKVVDTLMGGLMVGKSFNLPEGYIFKDENGNVINATKIVLEKKKKEYLKTYEECAKVLLDRASVRNDYGYKGDLLVALQRLLVCRDAYWKIAGDEMGLGKPWEPDWKNDEQFKYIIICRRGCIIKDTYTAKDVILAFPTEEMRDVFYENFKVEIESCKELL